jgi:phage gpG-like protein
MPDGATIEIKGLDELVKKLDDLSKLKAVHAGIKAAAVHVKGKIAKYPPKTAANRPSGPGSHWYERGKGSMYWRIRDNAKVSYGKKSEDLASGWAIKYNKSKFEAVVGNNVSYAVFVQGPKKGPKGKRQSKHMARIGWKSVDTVSKEETKRVQEYVFDAVMRAIKV